MVPRLGLCDRYLVTEPLQMQVSGPALAQPKDGNFSRPTAYLQMSTPVQLLRRCPCTTQVTE